MLKKTYKETPSGRSCQVTFSLPSTAASQTAHLLGEFNDWDPTVASDETKQEWRFFCNHHPVSRILSISLLCSMESAGKMIGRPTITPPNEYVSEDSIVEV